MKAVWRATGLGWVAIFAAGCVVSIGSGHDKDSKPRSEVPKPVPAPVVLAGASSEDTALIAEIDAAARLDFDSGRIPALKNVAGRPALSPPVQVHLVNTSLRALQFDNGKIEVLQTLIDNPGFSAPAREAVLRQLELLSFDSSRSTVLAAIQRRAAVP